MLAIAPLLSVAEVSIIGNAPDLGGKTMRVYGYTDFISNNTHLLGQSEVTEDGSFKINFETKSIKYVKMACDHIAAHIYVQPGTVYDLEFPLPPPEESRAFGKEADTEVIFNNLDINDINANIIDFNYNYEIFFQKNYELLRKLFSPRNYTPIKDSTVGGTRSRNTAKYLFSQLDDFNASMDSLYRDSDSEYFKLYRNAVIGGLVMNSSATDRAIYEEYIEPYDFSVDHPEFTRLHQRFYKFYFVKNTDYFGESALDSVLNVTGDFDALSAMMDIDDFAQNPPRKEIVTCFAIQEIWNGNIDQQVTSGILAHIRDNGSTESSRIVAREVLSSLTAAQQGFELKTFEFEDQFNQRRKLTEFRGSPTLLSFTADWCTRCLQENTSLVSLAEEFEGKIDFIEINITDVPSENDNKSRSSMIKCEMSEHTGLINDLRIKSLPYYVLLDGDGIVMLKNTPAPSTGLQAALARSISDNESINQRPIGSKEN